ncbi:hypothetical protein ACET3Z_001835 [Daucus carota]
MTKNRTDESLKLLRDDQWPLALFSFQEVNGSDIDKGNLALGPLTDNQDQEAMNVRPYYLIFLFLFSVKQATSTHVVIGAVKDNTSRAGMVTNVSLQMTIDDISRQTNPSLVLRMMNSIGEPATAALAGKLLQLFFPYAKETM